ncbi:hypothetical protein ZIOFF_049430 [Zingiber officinale]|uniref:Uncharacterized protein n=1 Tax=Zingiber officinale TaxID=94328 RepID=A0A8J5KV73_ZINOF|nr:hypothetical protein ZIOFF_049430 [Zingiber officinale]
MRARFTHSPSTAPIRTSEFAIADRIALSLFDGEAAAEEASPFWRWQRKDPGWVEGEQRQVRQAGADRSAAAAARKRSGDADRSREDKRTGGAESTDPAAATRTCWWPFRSSLTIWSSNCSSYFGRSSFLIPQSDSNFRKSRACSWHFDPNIKALVLRSSRPLLRKQIVLYLC